jgi:plasmid stabilization system protein ParE
LIVQLSTRAKREYDSALAFLSEANPQAAEDLGLRIEAAIASLSQMPNRGRAGPSPATRKLPVRRTPYVIVYAVSEDEVIVLRIRHTSQDPSP